MRSVVKLVEVVRAVEATQQFFIFIPVWDQKLCDQCLRYERAVMTRREIEGTFPYLEKVNAELWLPHVHPNCRCELRMMEEEKS